MVFGVTEGARKERSSGSAQQTSTWGDYEDYKQFFDATLPSARKDVFSGQLYVKVERNWQPVKGILRVLRSYAQDTNGRIKPGRLEDHLARYSLGFQPRLLVDLPPHGSRVDFLMEICRRVRPINITQQELYELLLEWGANMWRRFDDPLHQNQVLIFHSAQGVGKDYLLRSIFGGLDQWFINFTVSHNERENHATLNQALVINISEFDRTTKINAAHLKDMITRDSTFVRLPFDKCAMKRPVRASFVGSCNTKNILTDTTGNRRYSLVEIDSIDHSYPTDRSVEILAQFKAAADASFRASEATRMKMRLYIESISPKAPLECALEVFDQQLNELAIQEPQAAGIFSREMIEPALQEVETTCAISSKRLLSMLHKSGRSHRTSNGMIYGRPGVASRYRNKLRANDEVPLNEGNEVSVQEPQ